MRAGDLEKFSNFFLLLDGEQAVARSYGQQDGERAKRPHTKSRNGCLACKKRRVKCDERLPCGHCVNRREKCERPNPRPRISKVELPQQPLTSSHHVNTLHIELFYHFEKVTLFTLSFSEIWEIQLQESFKHEYLMHAILATAAKHMSVLRPQDPRYAEAAILLLNKSIESFRETLDTPLTLDNCEARVGTSFLINYIAWTELGFLEGQKILADSQAGGLDMSMDLLFLLGSGVRQVVYTAIPLLDEHGSPFTKLGQYRPCYHLQVEADKRGTRWREIMKRLLHIFDDPRYQGSPNRASSPSHQSSSPNTNDMEMDIDMSPGPSPKPLSTSSAGASPMAPEWQGSCAKECVTYDDHHIQRIIERIDDPASVLKSYVVELTDRTIYERVSQRLSVLVSFIPDDGSEMVPLSEQRHLDMERYFFSFPTLYFGPFLSLILENDSRALVVMYHSYRAASRLLRFEKTWWAAERAATMEKLTLAELKARGLSADI